MALQLLLLLSFSPLLVGDTYLPGDLNGDGEVTLADGVLLARAVVERAAVPCPGVADLTGSGEVNLGDVGLLLESLLLAPGSLPPSTPREAVPCPGSAPATPLEDGESGYSLEVTASGWDLRVRVSLETSLPARGGRFRIGWPEGFSAEALVTEVSAGLELQSLWRKDHLAAAQLGSDGRLRVV